MRKTRKGYLTALLLANTTLLSACGNANTITFWNPLTGDDGAYMEALVESYNETDPEFPVESVITSDMYTKIYTVMNTGKDIPDLTLIHADRVPQFADLNMLESVDMLTAAEPDLNADNYLETAWNAGNYEDVQYTIPLDIHGNVMYYNIDLLEKYDATGFLDDNVVTIDEMNSLAGQLEEGDYVVNNALIEWVALGNVVNLGGDISDADGNPTLNTPEMKEVVENLKSLADNGLLTPYGEDGYAIFQAGNVLFSTDGTWTVTAHASVEGLNFGLTNIYSVTEDKFTNRSSSHMFALLNNEERTDEKEVGIAAFLDWMRVNSLEWAEAGQIVASSEVFESEAYQEYPQSFFTSSEEEKEASYIFEYKYYSYIEQALGTVLNDMIYGNIDIDEGLQQAQKQVEDLIAESAS
ncbi:extracellular solute-binding protein [Fundicoccus culcitae]|uniref:Extracellular solute-binding protein n=1 Tax=Fundicoccus culcitae TaxID=2969821 RepID=A0ABY5PA61_9LACT|nr:extracellular solute-binding protein [Fundicoccus culcitae]UUX35390.1 extracellular solute-binding protein [Fundicoccus culcitae]